MAWPTLPGLSKVYFGQSPTDVGKMSNNEGSNQKTGRDVKESLKSVREGVERVSKDVARTTEKWVKETEKLVKETSPKVAATIDDTMEKTATALRRTMSTINKETKPQQVRLLRSYKSFLSKQVDIIEKRLKELAE